MLVLVQVLRQYFSFAISKKWVTTHPGGAGQFWHAPQRRSLELVCYCFYFHSHGWAVVFVQSALGSLESAHNGRRVYYCMNVQDHTHMWELMSYARRYAATKLLLYILCAVKRLDCATGNLCQDCVG